MPRLHADCLGVQQPVCMPGTARVRAARAPGAAQVSLRFDRTEIRATAKDLLTGVPKTTRIRWACR
jgi:hypothetical protein